MRSLFNEILDEVEADGGCDYVSQVALRFPNTIFMDLLGLPVSDADQFQVWVTRILHGSPLDRMTDGLEAMNEVMGYFGGLVAERRKKPTDDLLSQSMEFRIDGAPVSDGDLMALLSLLFMAGLDTVAMQLPYSMMHLAENDGDRQRLVEDPSLFPTAIEEFVRYYSFVTPGRMITVDTDVAECPMKAGQMVLLPIVSANRDPRAFANADQVLIDRLPNPHIGFGAGRHRCLGSHLARREMKVGMEEWHKRIPHYRLDPSVAISEHGGQMGLDNLPLLWTRDPEPRDTETPPPIRKANQMSDLTYRLFIDGKWVDSEAAGDVIEVLNPATEEVIGTVPQASAKDVVKAIEAARRAFDDGPWPRMSPKERSAVMLRMADVMERRMPEIVALNQREAGSVGWLAESIQVGIPLQHWRDMADRVLLQYQFEEPVLPFVGVGIGQGVIVKEPIGVVSLISAYNFPFFLSIMKLAPALAAGCAVILKPAPTTPLEAFIIGEFAEEAGLPAGVLNIVTGDIEAGQELTSNPLVDMVSFTGSDTVGRLVMAQAAPTMKKVVLELGGKSASIVCDDADLTKAIQDPIMGMTVHSGQGCSLLTRTLVHESRFDEFVEMIKGALSQITLGDPTDPATGMGPLISAAQRDKVEALIKTGVDEGATIAFGGGRPAGLDKGFYVEPTLFVDVDNKMTIAQKEFFGPVGVIIPFRDDEEAIRIANDSEFGLGGAVWAKDPARAYAIAKRIRTGMVTVNGGGGGLSPHYAFGGYKQSGLGREWGASGLGEFLETKTIAWGVASG